MDKELEEELLQKYPFDNLSIEKLLKRIDEYIEVNPNMDKRKLANVVCDLSLVNGYSPYSTLVQFLQGESVEIKVELSKNGRGYV
ncbi:hypothetical protein [Elizabethkingia anophelis]|uniref:hypothetical protein n=1 Tax=Elizabethkingia anophelis TaxID=1117645 RepID=UPI000D02D323|nr:hypothetical protein [Elizabethkingia anophelis]MCL1689413.1 hypothetical protein [Elizabethkingia anophelis]MDV4009457.1 hypothetical protein [Elizabethkingia anophelis]MYY49939.1 hypothetical protein [Elizabethkingia anophelis]PRQ84646.1 hypothetical protein CMT87_09035 [Elizabethkingia anophelis]PRQ85850.1 hypothetical protein CMT86_14260 [Elizabethkingia anophelis]